MKYPLAKNGIFRTIQGEGDLLGVPMVFVRLAGCSIGCPLCDTDYRKHRTATVEEICGEIRPLIQGLRFPWVWVTGGEPTDHDLLPLLGGLAGNLWWTALATAGHRPIPDTWEHQNLVRHLSVSPHDPGKWVQPWGDELKVIPGLNGFWVKDFLAVMDGHAWRSKYVLPCAGKPETVKDCVELVEHDPSWKMTVQGHKQWGLA